MKVSFTPAVIHDLRAIVGTHNERVEPDGRIRLTQAKALYKRWFNGQDPHRHAIAQMEKHLAGLRDQLEKAQQPFDESEHPRGTGGRFRSGGGRPRRDDNPLLTAAQTQVIPETRFSVLGPPIAGAAGIAGGMAAGATATIRGGLTDRAAIRMMRGIGHAGGAAIGGAAGTMGIDVPRVAARQAIGAINRRFGTALPRPAPIGAFSGTKRGAAVGGRVGAEIGGAATRATNIVATGPAIAARRTIEWLGGGSRVSRIGGRGIGALVGALLPGLVYARTLHDIQATVGPYEDTLFPRRVKKIAGEMFDAPEVLAKQAELLGEDALAKVSLAGASRLVGALAARFRRAPTAIGGAASRAPLTPAQEAAEQAFIMARKPVQIGGAAVGPYRVGRAGTVGLHALVLGGGGAGVGSLAGTAVGSFEQKHPRGAHGRFRNKAEGARQGATIGAAAGLGLGILTGLVAARRGHTALLTEALARLRGQKENAEGINLPSAMTLQAERAARTAHAHAYREANPKLIPPFAASGREPEHIAESLRRAAVERWMNREGTAMLAGAKAYYAHQLDQGFDAAVRSKVGKLGPLVGTDGKRVTRDLADTLDETQLSPQQKRVWDGLVSRRNKAATAIDGLYAKRAETIRNAGADIEKLTTERATLKQKIQGVPGGWEELKDDPAIEMGEIRDFARRALGYTVQARSVKGAIAEIDQHLPAWERTAGQRMDAIDEELPKLTQVHTEAATSEHTDLTDTELEAVKNPFATEKSPYFKNRPAGFDTKAVQERYKDRIAESAVRPFLAEQTEHAQEAIAHLNALVDAQVEQLAAGMPHNNAVLRAFRWAAPELVGFLHRAAIDTAAISTANREALTGAQRAIYDFVHAHKDPEQAAVTAWQMAVGTKDWAAHYGNAALRNWKKIVGILGPLTAFGAIDLQQPGIKKKFRLNPRTWKTPRDLGIVAEWPDPIGRPDEALFGLKYRDPQGRERFLDGIYITDKNGAHTQIPFGADLERVRSRITGGGGGGGGGQQGPRPQPIQVTDPSAKQEIDAVRKSGFIKDAGPDGFKFKQRQGGSADKAQAAVAEQLYQRHQKALDDNHVRPGVSTNRADRYWQSLKDTFEAEGSDVMDATTRAGVVFGGGQQKRRGVFANADRVYQSGDKDKITTELMRQIAVHLPATTDQYTQMRRALWLGGQHFDLTAAQQQRTFDRLDQQYEKSGKPTPASAETRAAGGESDNDRFEAYFAPLIDPNSPRHIAPDDRASVYETDENLRDDLHAAYHNHLKVYRGEHPNAENRQAHEHVQQLLNAWVSRHVRKVERISGLAKVDVPDSPKIGFPRPDVIRAPRLPRASVQSVPSLSGAPKARNITGASRLGVLPKPTHTGAPSTGAPSIGHSLRNAVRPAHALSQLGTYGLSQLGWDTVTAIANHALPGGGVAARAARFALGTGGGVAGAIGGAAGGRAAGRALGDRSTGPRQSSSETIARNLGGTAGQVAFNELAAPAVARGAVGLGARILGGAIGTAADPLIGPVGTALGAAAAGYLADEGVGILYHHLSRYGAHVPKMAAAKLGHRARA